MNKLIYIILLSISLTGIFTACNNDLNFSDNPNDRLSFSTDTVSFDTVFTAIGSSTRRLMVYNTGKKALNISSVRLANADKTGFHINIDGMGGKSEFSDVEIWAKDSLYVDIEVTVDPTHQDNPVLISDSILFLTNGVTQVVHLLAYGQDVVIWRGKIIEQDTLIIKQKPFLIYDSLMVAPNVTLSVERGVTFYFYDKASLLVKGNIKTNGTWNEPVVFRGHRSDNLLSDLPYDLVPGQWGGIRLFPESFENEFNYAYIRNGAYGILADSSDVSNVSRLKVSLKNSILHNVSGNLISGINYQIRAENCQLSNAGGAIVELIGGDGRFIHCTMANYMSLSARNPAVLVLRNYKVFNKKIVVYPIIEATFLNCIIHGSRAASGEVALYNEDDKVPIDAPFNHFFDHCLLGATGEDDENFVATLWNEKPNFRYLNDDKDYKYDFRLDSASVARNYGNKNVALECPFDITGKSRIKEKGPDLGCYEY